MSTSCYSCSFTNFSTYVTYVRISVTSQIFNSHTLLLMHYDIYHGVSIHSIDLTYSSYCALYNGMSSCLSPNMAFLSTTNSLPCSGLVKKSGVISLVGQYTIFSSLSLILSVTKKYLIFMCLDPLPTDFGPLFSRRIVLWLP